MKKFKNIAQLEEELKQLEEEQEVYKLFINSLQKIEHQKDGRKKLLIETIGLDRPYTISNLEILKAVESWLK